ncbi:hypothetical protein [Dankookia sp. GCM10030260]|uniref:hypothetical protein n=1 Tax=Dankookia sp. GCM10030260 TaxID=3273390 RepID=UPI0036D36F0B
MQRSDFDFDVIGGPSGPPLFPRPAQQPPAPPSTPAERALDPAAHRSESPAS